MTFTRGVNRLHLNSSRENLNESFSSENGTAYDINMIFAQLKFKKDTLIFLPNLIKIFKSCYLYVNIVCFKIGSRTATSSLLVEIRYKIYSTVCNFAHTYSVCLSIKNGKQNLCNSVYSLYEMLFMEYIPYAELIESDKQDLFKIEIDATYTQHTTDGSRCFTYNCNILFLHLPDRVQWILTN